MPFSSRQLFFIDRAFDLGGMILDVHLGSLRLAQHPVELGDGGVLQIGPALENLAGGGLGRSQRLGLRRSWLGVNLPDLLIQRADLAIDAAEGWLRRRRSKESSGSSHQRREFLLKLRDRIPGGVVGRIHFLEL